MSNSVELRNFFGMLIGCVDVPADGDPLILIVERRAFRREYRHPVRTYREVSVFFLVGAMEEVTSAAARPGSAPVR